MAHGIKLLVIGITILMLGAHTPIQAATNSLESPIKAPTIAQVSAAFDQIHDWAKTVDGWFTSYATSPFMQFLRSAKHFGEWLIELYRNRDELKSFIRSKVQSACGFFMVKYFATEICPR